MDNSLRIETAKESDPFPAASLEVNPLIKPGVLIPYQRIASEHLEPAVRANIELARQRLQEIACLKGTRTFANTVLAFDLAAEELNTSWRLINQLAALGVSSAIRKIRNRLQDMVTGFDTETHQRQDLWLALNEYAGSTEGLALGGPAKRLFEKTLKAFRDSGVHLPPLQRASIADISNKLAVLQNRFSDNWVNARELFHCDISDESDLSGLPERTKLAAREAAAAAGLSGWRLTLEDELLMDVLKYCDNPSIRKTLLEAWRNQCTGGEYDNRPIVSEVLKLRQEQARLLGYPSYSAAALSLNTLASPEAALDFVDQAIKKLRPVVKERLETLLGFKREIEDDARAVLAPWDFHYYLEKYRARYFGGDDESLRPYFELEHTLEGIMGIFAEVFGVVFSETKALPVWHPSVRTFEVRDAAGNFLGLLYLDLYARRGKESSAWCEAVAEDREARDSPGRHLVTLVSNYNRPARNKPVLLSLEYLSFTLAHELGHALHILFSRTGSPSLGSLATPCDFVEMPSTLIQEMLREGAILSRLGRHHQDGRTFTPAVLEKLERHETFMAPILAAFDLAHAHIDLVMHSRYQPGLDGEALDYADALANGLGTLPPEVLRRLTIFPHCFGTESEYASSYYSYCFCEALARDALQALMPNGKLDSAAAARLRFEVLQRGDEESPAALFEKFRLRPFSADAWLRRLSGQR